MDKLISLYKKRGETPLERLDRLRVEDPLYEREILSYAGRLDPMAEGLMLVLVGEEANHNRKKYLYLPKTYSFELLFGFKTDTGDVLGRLLGSEKEAIPKTEGEIKKVCEQLLGKRQQTYPIYSSRTVNGKPLFEWAREDSLLGFELPQYGIEIFELKYLSSREISKKELLAEILRDVSLVKGDFRQEETCAGWKKKLSEIELQNFILASFRVSCTSGTYVRALVDDISRMLGTIGIAYKIVREKVGEYSAGSLVPSDAGMLNS